MNGDRTGPAGTVVLDGNEKVCEIRNLQLVFARFRPGGRTFVGEEYPLPLCWMQYANHEDPERNTGSSPTARITATDTDSVTIECTGTTGSGSVRSMYQVVVRKIGDPPQYTYEIRAELEVGEKERWRITPNPSHGEVEFCNFWPEGIFSPEPSRPLRYDGCYLLSGGSVRKIPLHHVESSDKRNILLRRGDRLAWFLEEENPCFTLLSGDPATAGICAYMWDAHIAYRTCEGGQPKELAGGTRLTAAFSISMMGRDQAGELAGRAKELPSPEFCSVPAVLDGLHAFSVMCADAARLSGGADVWPWETEVGEGDPGSVRFAVDQNTGFDDRQSVRIDATAPSRARWIATTLGPAFRKSPFPGSARFRLEAQVRTALLSGSAGIGLRLHREGGTGLFDPASYEVHRAAKGIGGTTEWTRLVLLTPPIFPAPDRLHILLELHGAGTCWFDNVHLTAES